MIAHYELYGRSEETAVESVLLGEPLATAATDTIEAFSETSHLVAHVGDLAVEYGAGKPLAVFQALLSTYQTLVKNQAALAITAQAILTTAQEISSEDCAA